ncbi:MAG TPA: pyridoxal phosphate-dependent aminotransferase [Alphaproteobacteria bacterium]|nr:pyridoxal phosphate-dependent aminotransferase [Alphaproteobacteria bacterium]
MPASKNMPESLLTSLHGQPRLPPAVIPSFVAMDMMREANALAAAGRSVIHLETGQPSTGAPQAVKDAAARALVNDTLGYTEALGIRPLRERIARHYRERHGISIDPARVVATTGSSAGLMLAFLALTAPGGRVGMARPSYPCYRNIALALGMEPVEISCPAEDGFQPTAATLNRLNGPLDLLLVASPANPTGVVLPKERLAEIAGWCGGSGVPLVADEIYHGLTYAGRAATALDVSDDAIVLNGFSKYYSMTGWRLGWMIVPERMIRQVECLAQNMYIAPPSLSQHAALAAFDATEELEVNVARYAANRALLLEALPRLGLQVPASPDGAFYIYARLPDAWGDSVELAHRILRETGVAVTPGIDFDRVDGHRYIRIGYAGATEEIAEAIRRLEAWRP